MRKSGQVAWNTGIRDRNKKTTSRRNSATEKELWLEMTHLCTFIPPRQIKNEDFIVLIKTGQQSMLTKRMRKKNWRKKSLKDNTVQHRNVE